MQLGGFQFGQSTLAITEEKKALSFMDINGAKENK
jgi:hypothetical protein